MGYNITAGQQALMDYGMAQAEAISGRTEVTFELGKQSIKERIILEDEIESIEKLSRLAQQKARDRKRKGGFGGLGGFVGATLLSLAIPGSTAGLKALKVLLPGLGKQAGKALAGGFKDVKVGDLDRDVQDKLILSKTFSRLSKNKRTLLFSRCFIKFLIGSSDKFFNLYISKNLSVVFISFCKSIISPLENFSVLKE